MKSTLTSTFLEICLPRLLTSICRFCFYSMSGGKIQFWFKLDILGLNGVVYVNFMILWWRIWIMEVIC